jgi:hypothetical protein
MKWTHTTICTGLVLLAVSPLACTSRETGLAPTGERNILEARQTETMKVAYTRQRIPVRVAIVDPSTDATPQSVANALAERFNNVYGLAVNIEGIQRANQSFEEDGHVFLKAVDRRYLVGGYRARK